MNISTIITKKSPIKSYVLTTLKATLVILKNDHTRTQNKKKNK